MTVNPESYEVWIRALRDVRIVDHYNDTAKLDPEKIKQVTLTVPAWAAASMEHKCSSCGWPVYVYQIGSCQHWWCVNPECYTSPMFRSLSSGLKHYDQLKWERRERERLRKAGRESEKASKAEEERHLEALVESSVRRMFYSFGYRIRKSPRRTKK